MKISNVESNRIGEVVASNRPQIVTSAPELQPDKNGAGGNRAATVELSQEGQALATARRAVDATPDTRDELVSRLKDKVDSGNYHVSSSDIAEQMITRAQDNRLS
jgi:flagellar biosynthesis anti-sigma factor FlgM